MTTVSKILLSVALIIVIAFAAAFLVSRYLVSKLDGQGQVPAQSTLIPYSSEEGITFMYPDTYELSSHSGSVEEGDTLVFLPKGVVVPTNSEGPPSISMRVIHSALTSLELWIRNDQRSNFKLSGNGNLASTEVGGLPAYSYQHSGLYETDAIAVAHHDKIFLFEAGWLTPQDRIRYDFQNLVSSVQFPHED